MTAESPDEGLGAALIQISAHAERIAGLDAREAGHFEDIAAQLRDLAAEVGTRIDDVGSTLDRQAAIVEALDGIDIQVAALARQLAELADDDEQDADEARDYRPVPSPRWWKLIGADRDAALDRLRAWVEQIYRPGYGQLAAMLPACWERHPLCLYLLDWVSELWSVLYLGPRRDGRTLAAQGEWQTRLLPAAAEQMAFETRNCHHATATRDYPAD